VLELAERGSSGLLAVVQDHVTRTTRVRAP
jgi:hypothetical protein